MNTDLKNDDRRERVARAIARDENGDETGWQAWLNEADAVLADLGLTQAEPAQLQLRDRPPGATRPWSKWHAYDSRAERNHAAEDRKKHGWQVETRDLYTAPQPQASPPRCAQDNPELDDTPHESAAYARGRDAGFNAAVREVNKILDGKDSGTGVCSAEWQPTRERLLTQAGVVEAYAEACRVLESYPADYPHNSAGVALRDLCAALAAVKPAALVKEKDRA